MARSASLLIIALAALFFMTVSCSQKSNAQNETAVSTNPRPDYCGIWGIWGGERVNPQGKPWFKGIVTTTNWNEIEPIKGQFDWKEFDERVIATAEKGLNVMILVYHGNRCPEWVYDEGVPRVKHKGGRANLSEPYYLDPDFRPLLVNLIRETAKHIENYPPEVRKRIIGIQCPTGKSGDPQPYSGDPIEEKYAIGLHSPEWLKWTLDIINVYHETYKNINPSIFMLFKGPNPATNIWLIKNIPDSWRKPHSIAQGYQFSDEIHNMNEIYPLTARPNENGVVIRTRGELDNTEYGRKNWFNSAPVWNVYWSGLWNLTYGLDIWSHLPDVLEDERHVPAFDFFTKYAGYKDAAFSPGAWTALREGLDCMDTLRFPIDKYGELEPLSKDPQLERYVSNNPERFLKIAEEFAAYGAVIEDSVRVGAINLAVRGQRGINDVGANIWTDNYGMFIEQMDANETSVGYWRVGSKDEPFGRFARGFEKKSGKLEMRFNLDDRFFLNSSGSKHPVSIRVVYFDKGLGSWSIKYDAEKNPVKIAQTVTNTNTGEWKEIEILVEDARFENRGLGNSDIALEYKNGDETLFHMIEINRR